jgi:hypothetical protein
MSKLTMKDVNDSILRTLNPVNPVLNPSVQNPVQNPYQQQMAQTPMGIRNPVASMPNLLRYLAAKSPDMQAAPVTAMPVPTEITIPKVEKINFPAV